MPVTFLPFSALVPDGGHYGRQLDRAVNVLPMHGGYRSLRKKSSLASVTDGPMTGCHIHIYQQSNAEQVMRPDSDGDAGLWLPNAGATLYTQVDDVSPSDGDFVYAIGAPDDELVKLNLSDISTPSAGTQKLRWRYRIQGYSPTLLAVTSITRSGSTATVTTAAPHSLSTGAHVGIFGAGQAEYNGAFTITVTGASTFTYPVTGTPATPATGTITWGLAWKLVAELDEAGVNRATVTVIGSADTPDWVQREDALTPTVSNWAVMSIGFRATVPGVAAFIRPASDDAVGNWTTHAGAASGLYATLDEAAADDADYAQSPAIGVGQSSAYTVSLSGSSQFWCDRTKSVRYRYYAANAGMSLVITLLQGSTTIATWTHAGIPAGSWSTATQNLTSGQRAAIKAQGYTGLKLKFEASYPAAVASVAEQFSRPVSDVNNDNAWKDTGGATTDLYQEIDEVSADDNVTLIVSDATLGGAVNVNYIAGLGAITDPLLSVDHVLRFRWRRNSTGAAEMNASLYQGNTLIATVPTQVKSSLDNTWSTVTYTLTASQADSISDYSQLRVEFVHLGTFTAATAIRVTWAELSTPEPRRMRISWAEMQLPSAARADVSWVEYRAPTSETSYQGDIPTRFCGSKNRLYTFDESAFTDRSKAGSPPYGATSNPGSWYFCSWGNHIIATNFADPVQWRENNAGAFADLITSADKPKARFVCAARDGVMLGGINEASVAGHFPDEVWWSAFQNARDFQRAVATQCDSRRLYATAGQLMGLVGGDTPLVFKRRSFFELHWVGGRLVWQPRVVSRSVGTDYPRSIVQGQDEAMWWGGDCFYRYREGGIAEPLGKGIIARYLTDATFSAGAIKRVEPTDMAVEDQLMIGAYDPRSGIFAWSYQFAADHEWRHTRAILYNPSEDRWALLEVTSNANTSALVQSPNTTTSNAAELAGLVGLDYDGTDTTWFRYDGSTVYAAKFRTKTFAVELDDADRPQMVQIEGVVPVFSLSRIAASPPPYPDVAVKVEMALDPRLIDAYDNQKYSTAVHADQRQVLPFRISGMWARITVDIPEMGNSTLDAFEGLYIIWNRRGSGGA